MRSWFRLAGLPLLFASAIAAACPLCLGTAARSPAQDLVDLPRAVLAAPEGKHYRVVEVVKGERPELVLEDVVIREPSDSRNPLLLVRDDAWPMWVSLGSVNTRDAAVLRQLAARRPAENDTAGWGRRVDLALPHLESREPLLADIAYAECASAPYAALRAAKPRLDVRMLRRALDDPRLASRRPLYVLLLGIAGHASDAEAIEARLEVAWRSHDATNVGSLLAADLELRGPTRVAWVEDRYLRDASRTTTEIQAALLALSVQGNTRGEIPRERVIEAYLLFMREHRDIAGLVAQDLAAWRYWDAALEFAALLKSDVRHQYASRTAIVEYLRQSPLAVKID